MNKLNPKLLNGLTLAYIGDSVYETYVRKYFVSTGLTKVDDLHKTVINYTCAEFQASAMKKLLDIDFLSEDEILYFKRGRNAHVNKTRKSLSQSDYLLATGFESLIGFLHLVDKDNRIEEILGCTIKK